jgi:hypothetical protein
MKERKNSGEKKRWYFFWLMRKNTCHAGLQGKIPKNNNLYGSGEMEIYFNFRNKTGNLSIKKVFTLC